jgi:tryptophan synthase alpha chain
LPDTLARVRRATTLPICVGFGISRPEHAAAIGRLADGVVVGSALVAAADRSVDDAVALTRALRNGLDRANGGETTPSPARTSPPTAELRGGA